MTRSRLRALVATGLGLLGFALTFMDTKGLDVARSDFDPMWFAGRAVLQGQSPYVVGDSLYQSGWEYPMIYPGTAIVLVTPLGALPLRWAQGIWNGLGTAGLAWLLTTLGWWGLFGLSSAAFLHAYAQIQWSPLLLSGLLSPWLGTIWVAKPNIGLALFAGWPSKQAAAGGTLLILLSLILIPHWPSEMIHRLGSAPHIKPMILRPGGVLLLLALLRWRKPEARMLATLAVVPHTIALYEMLPLFLIPRTARQMGWLSVLTFLAAILGWWFRPGDPHHHLSEYIQGQWPFWFALVYLPALWLVLRGEKPTISHA